jgi:protein Mpv17
VKGGSTFEDRMLPIIRRNLFQPYNNALKTKPLLTKSLTGVVLAGSGDLIAQRFEKVSGRPKSSILAGRDPWRRFFAFAAFGCLWTGPFNHFWLAYLARRFPVGGSSMLLKKLFVQHMLWNPIVYLPVYFSFNGLLLGMNKDELIVWVKRDYWPMLVWCWIVWIPTTAFVFQRIPEHLQSVFMAGLSLGWNSFLSWKSNQ